MSDNNNITPPPELGEIAAFIWAHKIFLFVMVIIFAALGVAVALITPNVYRAGALLIPTQTLQDGGEQMSGQLGGLAALAGIGSGKGNIKAEMAEAKLLSKDFSYRFFKEHNLLVPLIAAEGWDKEAEQLIFNAKIYDETTKQFTFEKTVDLNWEAYKIFSKNLIIEKEKNGLTKIIYEHYSPTIAQFIVENLIRDINKEIQEFDITEADKSINYLSDKLNQTKVADMQVVFYKLIEEQMKSKMLTEIKDEYVFTTLDPAIIPQEKAGPNRPLILVVSIILGSIFSLFIVLFRFYLKR